MKQAALLLGLPAGRAARWLALHWLDEAAAAHARLPDAGDAEALHDFRVGLRRLRSTLRAFQEEVREAVRGRHRRRLRALAAATGAARDLEVQLAWLRARRPRARGPERAGIAWTVERLAAREPEARVAAEAAADAFPALQRGLERRLQRHCAVVRLDDPAGGMPFRAVVGRRIEAAAAALAAALGAITTADRQEEAHRARIEAKRLRYLLEPLAGAVPGAREAVRGLRRLQDLLGEMHDLHVMAGDAAAVLASPGAEPPPVGVAALHARLRRERDRHFGALRGEWLAEGAAGDLLDTVRGVAAGLAAPDEDREVERKYLLRRFPALDGLPVQALEVHQGYLPGDRLVERVRRVRGPEGTRFYRTVKLGSGISRLEVEEECTPAVFRTLWRLTRGRRVRKVRYRVPDGGRTWEIDRFPGRRLVLAEVELPGEEAAVEVPPWLAPVVQREVTGDPAYLNVNLAC